MDISRRGILGGAAGLGAAAPLAGAAAAGPGDRPGREYVISGGYVLSMDPDVGDLVRGEVHVRNGKIVEVAKKVRSGAKRLDAAGTIVMPGLVDTHWHLWCSLYRSMASASPETAYFALNVANGSRCKPSDLYHGARLGLVDALNTGITTVNDWSHNLRSPEHADANLRAHQEIGLRGRFSYGTFQGQPATQTIDLDDLARVQRQWFDRGRLPLMHLGLAGRPPGLVQEAVWRPEAEAAADLGLPLSYHANSTRPQGALEMIRQLGEQDLLGPDTQLIHALYTSEAERAMVRETGTSVSISPWSELLIGYGVTPVKQMYDADWLLTLSVDTLPLTGTGDLWSVARLATSLLRGQAEQELAVDTRRVLQMATLDAARGLGIGDQVGSLTPGKRADVVLVRSDDVATAPRTYVPNVLALAAGAENVDTVIVDGVVRKRGGRLLDVDAAAVVRRTSAALEALLDR